MRPFLWPNERSYTVRACAGELPDRAPLPNVAESAPQFQPTEEELEQVRSIVERQATAADYRPLVLLNANASDMLRGPLFSRCRRVSPSTNSIAK